MSRSGKNWHLKLRKESHISIRMIVFIPNLPFELAIGLWLLIKRARKSNETH